MVSCHHHGNSLAFHLNVLQQLNHQPALPPSLVMKRSWVNTPCKSSSSWSGSFNHRWSSTSLSSSAMTPMPSHSKTYTNRRSRTFATPNLGASPKIRVSSPPDVLSPLLSVFEWGSSSTVLLKSNKVLLTLELELSTIVCLTAGHYNTTNNPNYQSTHARTHALAVSSI